ncbi:MAG: STAS domain-containing protein [Akkermansiaceae bacterium]
MKPNGQVLVRHFDSSYWVRPEGKCTFMVSPGIKVAVEQQIEADASTAFFFDLEGCTGMDSTFMGMLAGLSMKLRKAGGAPLSIIEPGEKNQASLEELGLDQLMEVNPQEGAWKDSLHKIRASLRPFDSEKGPGREGHILECHENLCDADDSNNTRFESVLEVLRASGK